MIGKDTIASLIDIDMLIDSHTHLNFEAFKDDWLNVVDRAVKVGVEKMIVVGTDLDSSKKAVEMADEHKALYASVGIHPHHSREFLTSHPGRSETTDRIFVDRDSIASLQNDTQQISKLARHKKVVAIGEVGLDYHEYRKTKYEVRSGKLEQKRVNKLQKQLLGMQVQLAKTLAKPMIIHSRETGEDVLDVIEHFSKSDGKLPKGVFHCFDGSKKYLQKILEAGFYVSFTGNVTYVKDRAKVAVEVPIERLLLETDCPFMAPRVGPPSPRLRRGKSEPKDVKTIAEFHAKERGIDLSEVVRQTTKNAERLFGFRTYN